MCDPKSLLSCQGPARPLTRRFAIAEATLRRSFPRTAPRGGLCSPRKERGEVKRAALAVLATLAFALASSAASRAHAQTLPSPVELRILAINDFHGNLRPPPGGIRLPDPADKAIAIATQAGGAEHMATLIKQLRAEAKNTIFVAAGDLIGASPLLSAMFHDEPTIESLGMMGLAISSVGNHEFDEGAVELLRMQNGGCHPTDGCQVPHRFEGAKFRYL